MNYYISKDARKIAVSGVPVLGNIENGSFILLNDHGNKLIERIENGENIKEDLLEENLQELIKAALEANILVMDNTNVAKHHQNSIYSAYIHVTNSCNLHCIGCYSDNCNRNEKEDLSLEEIKFILLKLHEKGLQNLLISGGEPFLRKDIIEILRYAKKDLGISKIIVGTNGTVQNLDLYKEMKGLVDNISLSIDGYSMESADVIRDKGTFEIVIKTVEIIKKCKIPMVLLPTIHKYNYKEIPEYLKFASLLELPIGFSLLTCNHPDNKVLDKYILNEQEFIEFVAMNIENDCNIEDTPLNLNDISFKASCGAGKNIISVDASGDVYPCHMLQNSEYKLGNILKDSLEDMLMGSKNQSFIGNTVENIIACKKCEYKYFCGGGCKARTLFHSHTFNESDMYCKGFLDNYERLGRYFCELSNNK